ncbi:hypothetical protein AB0E83_27295 [Streptomyces sp. NPDC035033]|uniref:hypothetical protein n=1 Tax=Streptomyces sp. NPDC035033 TaxID=3155368 RepID=UPI003402BC07
MTTTDDPAEPARTAATEDAAVRRDGGAERQFVSWPTLAFTTTASAALVIGFVPPDRSDGEPLWRHLLVIGFVPPDRSDGEPLWRHLLVVGGGLLVLGVLVPAALPRFREPEWVHPEHREPSGTP